MISKHQKGEIEEIILKKAFDSVKGAYISRCNGNKQSPQTRTNIKVNIKLPPPEPPVMQQNFEEFSNSDHYPLPPHFVEGYLNFIHNFYFKQIFNWKYQLNNYTIQIFVFSYINIVATTLIPFENTPKLFLQ